MIVEDWTEINMLYVQINKMKKKILTIFWYFWNIHAGVEANRSVDIQAR